MKETVMSVSLIIFGSLVLLVTEKIVLKSLSLPSDTYAVFVGMLVAFAIGCATAAFDSRS